MRAIKSGNATYIKEPFSKEIYFSVFNPHPFSQMNDCDYCCACSHSRYIHFEYGVDEVLVPNSELDTKGEGR